MGTFEDMDVFRQLEAAAHHAQENKTTMTIGRDGILLCVHAGRQSLVRIVKWFQLADAQMGVRALLIAEIDQAVREVEEAIKLLDQWIPPSQ